MIHGVWPIICNCFGYSDQHLVEFACLSVIRAINSYYRSSPENLEIIVDAEFITTVNFLLATLFTSQLTTFTAAARPGHVCMHHSQHQDCPSGRGHVNTLNQILIGILPSSRPEREEQGNALRQGLGGLAVTQNFAHHPKDCRGSVGHFYERYDHLPR